MRRRKKLSARGLFDLMEMRANASHGKTMKLLAEKDARIASLEAELERIKPINQ